MSQDNRTFKQRRRDEHEIHNATRRALSILNTKPIARGKSNKYVSKFQVPRTEQKDLIVFERVYCCPLCFIITRTKEDKPICGMCGVYMEEC